ncbi:MAG: TonB family protein [Sphingomonadales bacterium]|jgi:TonB family protein|uniref:energy transducer TonB n=2 Tax=Sphingorhabdus sp. TaxID=1902408 RepID=UPI003C780D1B|nr:TonB family protein [Sphingomonadales bacterium]MBK9432346.1 TonB family protein [Sphingomonadales bacterium]MBL0022120.1 TonB family protein [Sphingomonadales bacterium]
MAERRLFFKVTAWVTVASLALTPEIAAACTYMAPQYVISDDMRQKCRAAVANPRKFLAKVAKDTFDSRELGNYIVAFDEGAFGCRENRKFAFRILDSFYSKPDRLFTQPALLRRYAFTWPENHDPAREAYINGLVWLLSDHAAHLPSGWTAEQARDFVSQPGHFKIALERFGTARDRDDAVFAIVSDPKSPHFDRDAAIRLTGFTSRHQFQRRLTAVALFINPALGPTDLAKAETLLPVSALYDDSGTNPLTVNARTLWEQVAGQYAQSSDAGLREKARSIRAKMAPPSLTNWPKIEYPKDGRVWLSLADWPKNIPNPFGSPKYASLVSVADYPARALRNEETGAVTVAARFGTDGRFSGLEVLQSSGSAILDDATTKTIHRRFRPKLNDMTVSGFAGKEVRVPLLIVDWQLSDTNSATGSVARFSDGRLTIVAEPMIVNELYSSCGPPPSIFL